jgi:hypothetical protein
MIRGIFLCYTRVQKENIDSAIVKDVFHLIFQEKYNYIGYIKDCATFAKQHSFFKHCNL